LSLLWVCHGSGGQVMWIFKSMGVVDSEMDGRFTMDCAFLRYTWD